MKDKVINLESLGWFLEDLKTTFSPYDFEELTEKELEHIITLSGGSSSAVAAIYTENFEEGEYTPESWAVDELGYASVEGLMSLMPDVILDKGLGCEKWEPTGEVFNYDGDVYYLYQGFSSSGGSWEENGILGLVPESTNVEDFANLSLAADSSNFYTPFYGKCTSDGNFYNTTPEDRYILLYVEYEDS